MKTTKPQSGVRGVTWRWDKGSSNTGRWRINFQGKQTSKRDWNDPNNPDPATKLLENWKLNGAPRKRHGKKFDASAAVSSIVQRVETLAEELAKAEKTIEEMELQRQCYLEKVDTATALIELRERSADKTRPMSRDEYRRLQKRINGPASIQGQQVCHIIAENNGGANHPDNFVMADGGMNSHNSNLNDPYYVTLIGLAAATKAVDISRTLGTYNGPDAATLYRFGKAQAKATKDIVAPYYDMWCNYNECEWSDKFIESRKRKRRGKKKRADMDQVIGSERDSIVTSSEDESVKGVSDEGGGIDGEEDGGIDREEYQTQDTTNKAASKAKDANIEELELNTDALPPGFPETV
jgi:hypothetical protein